MPTQKRSGEVSITLSQVLNYRMSGTITGNLEGGGFRLVGDILSV